MFESIRTVRNPAIKLYALIGYCVSTTAEIEHELFECFRVASGKLPAEAARIFFKAPSQEHRLTTSDAAVTEFLSAESDQSEWARLRQHLAEHLGPDAARNLIAHNPASGGVYVSYPEACHEGAAEREPEIQVMMEVAQHYGLVALGRRTERTESIETLSDYAELLTQLYLQLSNFRRSLAARTRP